MKPSTPRPAPSPSWLPPYASARRRKRLVLLPCSAASDLRAHGYTSHCVELNYSGRDDINSRLDCCYLMLSLSVMLCWCILVPNAPSSVNYQAYNGEFDVCFPSVIQTKLLLSLASQLEGLYTILYFAALHMNLHCPYQIKSE